MNLIRGAQYLHDDLERRASGRGPVGTEEFTPGARLPSRLAKWCFAIG